MSKSFVLSNDFHETYARVRPKVTPGGEYYLSKRQAQRAARKLCGLSTCLCGAGAGERPPQGYWLRDDLYMLGIPY